MSGSFESLRWNARVHRLNLGSYSHPKEFWGNEITTHVNFKGKIPSAGKILPSGGSNPRRCIKQDSEPNTLPTDYSGPVGIDLLFSKGTPYLRATGLGWSWMRGVFWVVSEGKCCNLEVNRYAYVFSVFCLCVCSVKLMTRMLFS